MKYEVKKIGVWTTAEYFALLGLMIGIVLGIMTAVYISMLIKQLNNQTLLSTMATQYGVSLEQLKQNLETQIWSLEAARKNALIWIPLAVLAVSFIFGLIFSLLYNLLARWKGLTIELKEQATHAIQTTQPVQHAEHKAEHKKK